MKRTYIAVIEVDTDPEWMNPGDCDSERIEDIILSGISEEVHARWKDKWGHNLSSDFKIGVTECKSNQVPERLKDVELNYA